MYSGLKNVFLIASFFFAIISVNAQNRDIVYQKMMQAANLKSPDSVIHYSSRLLELSSHDTVAYVFRGWAYCLKGEMTLNKDYYKLAFADLDMYIKSGQRYAQAFYWRGRTSLHLADEAETKEERLKLLNASKADFEGILPYYFDNSDILRYLKIINVKIEREK